MTRTARGQEIDMASLIASNEEATAVGNVPMNARGDLLGPGGVVEAPAEEIQEAYEEKQAEVAKQPEPTITDLHKKYRTPGKEEQVVFQEREFERDGKKFVEIEYEDGSIEEKEVK